MYCDKLLKQLKHQIKHQNGLSLIEIIVAFTILTIVCISLVQSFPFGLSINKTAESATIASYLAQDKIEELHSLGYDNIITGVIEEKHFLSNDPASYLYNFQRQTKVNCVDGNLLNSGENTGMKKISATIYYTSAISRTETSYNITTLISKK